MYISTLSIRNSQDVFWEYFSLTWSWLCVQKMIEFLKTFKNLFCKKNLRHLQVIQIPIWKNHDLRPQWKGWWFYWNEGARYIFKIIFIVKPFGQNAERWSVVPQQSFEFLLTNKLRIFFLKIISKIIWQKKRRNLYILR